MGENLLLQTDLDMFFGTPWTHTGSHSSTLNLVQQTKPFQDADPAILGGHSAPPCVPSAGLHKLRTPLKGHTN